MRCDLTLHGATIHTLRQEGETFSVLGIRDGRVAYLGDSLPEEPGRLQDLTGHTILPGFVDAHVHFSATGLLTIGLDLRWARSFADVRDSLQSYLDAAEDEPLVLGFGLMGELLAEGRLPNRFDLDRLLPDQPLLLIGGEGHSLAANSAALDFLALPADVRGMERDPVSGEITGLLRAEAYYQATQKLTSAFDVERLAKGLMKANNLLLSRGITSLHASEGTGLTGDIDILGVLAMAPALEVGVRVYPQVRDVRKVRRLGLNQIGGCFATAIDGSTIAHTAAFLEPYSDRPGEHGLIYFPQEELDAFVEEAHHAGMQINLHAIGDRAIELALRAYERALRTEPRAGHRHRIEHCGFPTRDQLQRIADLGLVVSVQPIFNTFDPRMLERHVHALGEERMQRAMPLQEMLSLGIPLAGSSDMPVMDANPLAGVQGAVLHPNPDQRISVYQALRMHTLGSAFAGFQEERKGSLEIGKDADFLVLERDPFSVPAEQIRQIRLISTYLNGKLWRPRPISLLRLLWSAAGGHLAGKSLSRLLKARVPRRQQH